MRGTFAWNDISSNVGITVQRFNEDNSENPEDINVHEGDLLADVLGITYHYKKGLFGYSKVSSDSNKAEVSQTRIILDTDIEEMDDYIKYKVYEHELGHALMLCHPYSEVENRYCTEICLMQQGSSGYYAWEISEHDKNNLIAKWGE